jgi:D-alanine-D-alanine ligase
MKVLVIHSDVSPDAPPEDQDTLFAARAISQALISRGYEAPMAAFLPDLEKVRALVAHHAPAVVFNMVEGIEGKGRLAYIAPLLFDEIGVPYTGTGAEALIATGDKPLSKRMFREAGLPTPDWSEPPNWNGLYDDARYIVKSADEDASVGLDDSSVVAGRDVPARAELCAGRFGGPWFAERYVDGREFNVSVLEESGGPRVLPIAEMTFEEWPAARPRIVGYTAKWHDRSFESTGTVRRFGVEEREPGQALALRHYSECAWDLFKLRGTARVDFRMDEAGRPLVLEVNPNPGIAPDAGFAAAAASAGLSYADLIERIVMAALP